MGSNESSTLSGRSFLARSSTSDTVAVCSAGKGNGRSRSSGDELMEVGTQGGGNPPVLSSSAGRRPEDGGKSRRRKGVEEERDAAVRERAWGVVEWMAAMADVTCDYNEGGSGAVLRSKQRTSQSKAEAMLKKAWRREVDRELEWSRQGCGGNASCLNAECESAVGKGKEFEEVASRLAGLAM